MSSNLAEPLVTVLVPTHDHASTLDLAVTSVLRQSVEALDVVIIGDGVGDDTRDVVSGLVSDSRVRFLDTLKTNSRAELVRHSVLAEALSPYVCYFGDDDLMLPDHVESTVARLQGVDFTHPPPVFIDRGGSLVAHPTDIADSACVTWHLHPLRNAISLTGVGHRLDAYRRLPYGWREPPPGSWSDHYMWQQWFGTPGFRYSTGDRLTMLKLDGALRAGMSGDGRRQEMLDWISRSTEPGFESWLASEVADAFRRHAVQGRLDHDALLDRSAEEREAWETHRRHLTEQNMALAADLAHGRAQLAALTSADARARQAQGELDAIRGTRTWQLHESLARYSFVRRLARH